MCASEKGDMESPGEEAGRPVPPHPVSQTNGSNKIIGRNVNGTSKSLIYIIHDSQTHKSAFVFKNLYFL